MLNNRVKKRAQSMITPWLSIDWFQLKSHGSVWKGFNWDTVSDIFSSFSLSPVIVRIHPVGKLFRRHLQAFRKSVVTSRCYGNKLVLPAKRQHHKLVLSQNCKCMLHKATLIICQIRLISFRWLHLIHFSIFKKNKNVNLIIIKKNKLKNVLWFD